MAFSMRGKTCLFIDGANFHGTMRMLGIDVDYHQILKFVQKDYDLLRAFYYTAVYEENSGYKPLQQLIDFLNLNGFFIRLKPAKSYDNAGVIRIKGNMDVEIAVDSMRMAKHMDHMFLFSGDGDFRYLIDSIQNEGVRVTVVSSLKVKHCSVELRRQADEFIELEELRQVFRRDRS
jgi:uncharacterized LabA/DUF88 family protein